ncbi:MULTISPECIES: AbrB/MazE/SpoVT family DNA-binding domain-containing protein [Sporosarcina]|uniref:AbrB/MazE/SpoVT family DNA-binding domain-containing protein n=1 Tax=Sporosarcina TaxID=1569 RepID=UPI00058B12B9|nr:MULTISPECIES: AbrB/MazE/SpoVT family DNA-binding domain-containing protein [Sporosarcina]WJY27876.1 AbrB/MazE/SpoVT family DNA-binding domain-containing protein [Sporosarcina sp. 0.2-SM1T-5]
MKNLGILRKVDHLGRIVLPKELRTSLHIPIGQPLEFFTEDDQLILRSYRIREACAVTGEIADDNFRLSNGMYVSPKGAQLLLGELNDKF